jgi:hypothetical protein
MNYFNSILTGEKWDVLQAEVMEEKVNLLNLEMILIFWHFTNLNASLACGWSVIFSVLCVFNENHVDQLDCGYLI